MCVEVTKVRAYFGAEGVRETVCVSVRPVGFIENHFAVETEDDRVQNFYTKRKYPNITRTHCKSSTFLDAKKIQYQFRRFAQ